jgi:hypothetical protein
LQVVATLPLHTARLAAHGDGTDGIVGFDGMDGVLQEASLPRSRHCPCGHICTTVS